MKRATLVSLVLMIPVLSGGCAVDALTWALTGFGLAGDQYQPDYGSKPDPPVCVEPYMAKRADGTDVLAYRPVTNRPGCR
jgi:hypothetical protein